MLLDMATTFVFNSNMTQKPTTPLNPASTPGSASKKAPSGNPMKQLENVLDLYLGQKAPAIPENIKEMIVNFAPWLIIITIVLASPLIFAALGFGALLAPFTILGGIRYGARFNLSLLILAASLVLEIIAVPGLFKRTAKSWRLVFYATLINAVYTLFQGDIGSLIIGTGLSLYILFQVKKHYSN